MYKKKTVFISASSSGIGYHLAKEYKSIGYNVIINGKNISKLKKASVSLDKCSYFLGDLTDKKKIKVTIKKIKKNVSKIICISSICGVEYIDGAPLGYSIAKSALNFYIKLISKELANKKITINGIVPGNIIFEGSTWDLKIKQNLIKTKKYIKDNVPANSFGSPKDIFEVCKMISENKSKFITGSLFKLDGGQTKSL
jgi:NAD(P)-dependent dehydrogenase (short-subunit alcohol dehydrogenase family)